MHLRELFLKEDDRSTAVFAFGRFNPPTIGHEKLINKVQQVAAKEYVKEFGSTQDDVSNMFPKETREQVARVISDRVLENIKQGEYNAPKGTVS